MGRCAVSSREMSRWVLAVALACCLGSLACWRAEDDPEVTRARQANELSRDLMSPFCPGRTLADCGSPDAAAVRAEIHAALRAGEQPEQVRARIEARFGDHVVGVPREALGWLLPILVLIAGAGGLVWVLRRALRAPPPAARPLSPELEARLARELDDVDAR
jgi:cytochrome c-type biogenesis protein CcmH/NrfF